MNRVAPNSPELPVREHSLHAHLGGIAHFDHSIELALHPWRLFAAQVALHAVGAHQLARTGDLESGLRALVRLKLGLVPHRADPLAPQALPVACGSAPCIRSWYDLPCAPLAQSFRGLQGGQPTGPANRVPVPGG